VRKLLIFFSLWLGLAAGVDAAETFALASGATFSGDIVKFDDHDAMIHMSTDTYTNINWPDFSQDTLKQLAANPKYRAAAMWFIQPTERAAPAPLTLKYDRPMSLPEHPSIIGGIVGSSLGWFLLLALYAANLYAAFEVALVRGRPVGLVMGVSAVLPIAGPIIFLAQPMATVPEEAPPEEVAPAGEAPVPAPGAPGATATAGGPPAPGHEDIQIVSASWQPSQEEKKPQAQVFSRGKFTLNKRFIETKFAGFIGEPKGEALAFTMEVKTLKDTLSVECIKQVSQTEAIVETPHGQMTVPFADIQEFKLIPKPPAA
jgi:hypothetical protein